MSTKPGPCAFCVVDEYGHVCTGACDKQATPTRTEPTECNDNDSPWLICKTCAADGKCARNTRTEFEAAAYRWRFKAGADRTWRYCEKMPGFDPAIVEFEPLFAIAAAMGWPTVPEKGG